MAGDCIEILHSDKSLIASRQRHVVFFLVVLVACLVIFRKHARATSQLLHEHLLHASLPPENSRTTYDGRPGASQCLKCDILDIRLPSKAISDKYSDIDDWSLEGTCPLPRDVTGNSTGIIQNILNYKDRCTGGSCTVWIAFIGDSQLRGPFVHLINAMFGAEWPVGAKRNVWDFKTYHTDHRVCCRPQRQDEQRDNDDTHGLSCTFTRALNTAAYVRSYLRDSVADDKHPASFCLTWQWSMMADASLRKVLANYTGIHDGDTVRPHDAILAPQMIVVNPGLHPILVGREEDDYIQDVKMMLYQMHNIATTQLRMSLQATRFVVHEITAVVDSQMKGFKVDKVNQTMAARFNKALTACLRDTQRLPGSSRWLRVFPAYRLTRHGQQHGLLSPKGDGLHYTGGYDNIVAQLDLYFMNTSAANRFCLPR